MNNSIPSGVITGKDVQKIFKLAKEKKFAIPAVNVIGSNSINAVLETASKLKSPVIIQFSNGGAQFNAGKGLVNNNQSSAIAGAISGAKHVLGETERKSCMRHLCSSQCGFAYQQDCFGSHLGIDSGGK